MKTYLALLLILLPVAISHAADNDRSSEHHENAAAKKSAKLLADQVSDIVHSPNLTLKEKDDHVSAAVKNAVSDAVANLTESEDILKVTLELTTAAATSAPQFTHAIDEAISGISAITSIDGALNQIKTAVVDAAAKAAAAAFDSDHKRDRDRDRDEDRDHEDHDHDPDDHVVSPSH